MAFCKIDTDGVRFLFFALFSCLPVYHCCYPNRTAFIPEETNATPTISNPSSQEPLRNVEQHDSIYPQAPQKAVKQQLQS